MSTFLHRLKLAEQLENTFIETIKDHCRTHRIAKFGIESSSVAEVHEFIRRAQDPVARFVRYLPDALLVRVAPHTLGPNAAFVEFKVQNELIYSDSFFRRIQEEYGNTQPPLDQKEQIFALEAAALDAYHKLEQTQNQVIVVVAWQRPTDVFRAQFVKDIVICQAHHAGRRVRGSGTPMYNTHIDSFRSAPEFFPCRIWYFTGSIGKNRTAAGRPVT